MLVCTGGRLSFVRHGTIQDGDRITFRIATGPQWAAMTLISRPRPWDVMMMLFNELYTMLLGFSGIMDLAPISVHCREFNF